MAGHNSALPPKSWAMKWKASSDPKEGKWMGLRPHEHERADGMDITWDLPVQVRDGTKLYVDLFRPAEVSESLPTILTYSPYGKHGPKTFDMFPNSGVPKGSVSRYAAWEAPDPLYWTKRGYAVVNADARGSWGCEGDCTIVSPEQAQDGHDLVEWAAQQLWSNGRVGMCGVSYLAIVQWRVAETNPPHLSCIMPWEGFTDVYRDYSHHGGIPETNFAKFMEWSCRCGLNRVEDWVSMLKEHHLFDSYYESKQAQLSQICCPAYVVADWGDQGLHTRGTLIGFSNIRSTEKWLEIHGRKKWQYFYQSSSLQRQEAFFQKFLKGQASEIDNYPRVRIEVRDRCDQGAFRAEAIWPIRRTKPVLRYLDSTIGRMKEAPTSVGGIASYDSEQEHDHVDFSYTFGTATELTGSMRLRLWVSTDATAVENDMDLFVQLDKLVSDGSVVPFVAMSMLDDGPLALGWLRVSHREVDEARSTVFAPWHLHERELRLRRGEVVPIDMEIWPSSTKFEMGETLRVRVQGNDVFRYDLPQVQLHQDSVNRGRHFIHTGGLRESFLVMPVVETEGEAGVVGGTEDLA